MEIAFWVLFSLVIGLSTFAYFYIGKLREKASLNPHTDTWLRLISRINDRNRAIREYENEIEVAQKAVVDQAELILKHEKKIRDLEKKNAYLASLVIAYEESGYKPTETTQKP